MYSRDLSFTYNRSLIDYVTNQIYIFKASNIRLIQMNYLFYAKTEYLYQLAVNNIYRYRLS